MKINSLKSYPVCKKCGGLAPPHNLDGKPCPDCDGKCCKKHCSTNHGWKKS